MLIMYVNSYTRINCIYKRLILKHSLGRKSRVFPYPFPTLPCDIVYPLLSVVDEVGGLTKVVEGCCCCEMTVLLLMGSYIITTEASIIMGVGSAADSAADTCTS